MSRNCCRREGGHSINTRTTIAPSNHVLKVDLRVTRKNPGVHRLYTFLTGQMYATLHLRPADWDEA